MNQKIKKLKKQIMLLNESMNQHVKSKFFDRFAIVMFLLTDKFKLQPILLGKFYDNLNVKNEIILNSFDQDIQKIKDFLSVSFASAASAISEFIVLDNAHGNYYDAFIKITHNNLVTRNKDINLTFNPIISGINEEDNLIKFSNNSFNIIKKENKIFADIYALFDRSGENLVKVLNQKTDLILETIANTQTKCQNLQLDFKVNELLEYMNIK